MSVEIRNLSHIYNADTTFKTVALDHINLKIKEGSITAIIGETGSGKSTLVQHLNALLLPSEGEIQINDKIIKANEKPKQLKALRKNVGLVFQFPEYQLFEETILQDICFGPKNFGMSEEDAILEAKRILKIVGLDESYCEKSPFECSGGEKRRVAIAGILAMDPQILVLDEPTAGLDPKGAKDMMELFMKINKEFGKTILLVTHDMEHVLDYCENVVVVSHGKIVKDCKVNEFFSDIDMLHEMHINPPAMLRLKAALQEKGFDLKDTALTNEELVNMIVSEVKK